MNRKKFIVQCGYACLGALALPPLLQACSSINLIQNNRVNGKIDGSDLVVPLSAFNDKNTFVIVLHDDLNYPICVYRFTKNDYSALLMACTHQGTELQVFGNTLECPAHGSEFNNRGEVENGPAEKNLHTFPVNVEADRIKISLKSKDII